ncbi:MAG TPA: hypothetical protein VKH44_14780 [Pirellulaceae bacterium]|nr:hypothetical protein [Pirellulaceae bacterium]
MNLRQTALFIAGNANPAQAQNQFYRQKCLMAVSIPLLEIKARITRFANWRCKQIANSLA